jgi:ERCC4-type nuclease
MKNDIDKVKTELTYEKLKTYKGFENITEAEAVKEIEIIKKLAKILYYMYLKDQKNSNNKNTEL